MEVLDWVVGWPDRATYYTVALLGLWLYAWYRSREK